MRTLIEIGAERQLDVKFVENRNLQNKTPADSLSQPAFGMHVRKFGGCMYR